MFSKRIQKRLVQFAKFDVSYVVAHLTWLGFSKLVEIVEI